MMGAKTLTLIIAISMSTLAFANPACESEVITSLADVSVSDGTSYQVETYYRLPDESVVTFLGENGNDIVSEGPYAWYRKGEKTGLMGDKEKRFAIGHQYHAMLLNFDRIMSGVHDEKLEFLGESRIAKTGQYPYGGTVSLVEGDEENRPAGFLMLLPEETPIEVSLQGWHQHKAGHILPNRLEIHHGGMVFTYNYEWVNFSPGDAADFQARYPLPEIDEIQGYREGQLASAAECDDVD